MKVRILIVEDNELNKILLRDILAANRYELFEAENGQKALEIARIHKPDLILMDIQLPEMDGVTITRILKGDPQTKGIPVVAVSSYAFEREKNHFYVAGGDIYLSKPIDVDKLLNVVKSFLGEKE